MAVKDWWNALTSEWGWGDDDDSAFDDDLWADLGIDPESIGTGPTITPTAEDDPYGIGSLFDPAPNIYGDEDWATTYDFGDWGAPAEDFEDPSFDYSSFDIDAYLDSILNPDYGESYTEGDPSDWFINTGDPAYQDYSGVGGGGSPPPTDPTLLKIAGLLGPNALGPTIVPEEEAYEHCAKKILEAKVPTIFPGPLVLWKWNDHVAEKAVAIKELADEAPMRLIPMADYRPKYPKIEYEVEINPNHPNLTILI